MRSSLLPSPSRLLTMGRGRPRRSRPVIEFLCRPEDEGVISPPVAARSSLPTWFRELPGVDRTQLSATNNGITVKRCLPFLDALGTGWLVPLAATVRLEVTNDGNEVTAGWEFDRQMVSNHAPFQVAGNPWGHRPPMKFHNYWTIRTPPGWSTLFVPPLNRRNDIVDVLSGVVDTDTYQAPVNFPFVTIAPDGIHTLEKGMPLVQAIPFRRTSLSAEAVVRAESDDEANLRTRIHRNTMAGSGWYRRHTRQAR